MTSTVQFLPAEAVLPQIAELRELVVRLSETTTNVPAFLPLKKLAAHFGIGQTLAKRYVSSAISCGRLEVLRPSLNGVKGNPLYSVSDFKLYLASNV